jgi:hypothetical protein
VDVGCEAKSVKPGSHKFSFEGGGTPSANAYNFDNHGINSIHTMNADRRLSFPRVE